MMGKVAGKRGVGRRKKSWLRNLREWTGISSAAELLHLAKDKETYAKLTANLRCSESATMDRQLSELVAEPSGEFQKFTRMSQTDFDNLLNKVLPAIAKQDTQLRKAIPARIRLAITLRYLATGDSFESLHFLFKISPQLISKIIPEVCQALNEALKEEIKLPTSPEEWKEIEKGFAPKFPRAIGSIDGKHIVIECPIDSGSEYINYKKTFSIVLNSLLWNKICLNELNLPTPHPLPNSYKDIPYVFLGDGAFALTEHIMKPYPGNHDWGSPKRKFYQRLSSARVVVENTFGILVTRFRIFKKPIQLNPEKVKLLTLTCILLHNFLRKSSSLNIYSPHGTVDAYDENNTLITPGLWRNEIERNCAIRDIPHLPRRAALNAREIRDEFTNYFQNN
ncbi:hypothetical protein evm_013115 [Chilo suppressalis]|nr:hypothetical protein evm_013115 [Chilo suppressalis]